MTPFSHDMDEDLTKDEVDTILRHLTTDNSLDWDDLSNYEVLK